jgi:hypothetical protein
MRRFFSTVAIASLLLTCKDSGLYAPCDRARDCDVPDGQEAACVRKDNDGYCSWICEDDGDCRAEGDNLVCASFEENPDKYCFPTCGGGQGCPDGFECRSTGGGVNQDMVCFPN